MKRVLITGAAGGIGSEIVRLFAANNYFVYAVDIDAAACRALAASIGEDKCAAVTLDVTDNDAIAGFVASLAPDFALDHVITLAGRADAEEWKPFRQIEPRVLERSIRVNLLGQIQIVHAMYPFLLKNSADKSVTLISSINAKGCFGLPAYSAAKAGLGGFMSGVVKAFGDDGVRINVVSPGTVVTKATLAEPKNFDSLLETTALHRFVTSEDVAKLVWSVCNDFVSVTGHDFVIDAGQLRNHGG